MHLPRARHPLLLARSLPALPAVPEYDDSEFENNYMGRIKTVADYEDSAVTGRDSTGGEGDAPRGKAPRSVDLTVQPGKTGVILTGPNTGI